MSKLLALLVAWLLVSLAQPAWSIGEVTGQSNPRTEYKLTYIDQVKPSNAGGVPGTVRDFQGSDRAAVCMQWLQAQATDASYTQAATFGSIFEATAEMTGAVPNCLGVVTITATPKPAAGCTVNCVSVSGSAKSTGYQPVTVFDTQCPSNASDVGGGICICNAGFRPPFSGPQTSCNAHTCAAQPRSGDRVLEGLTAQPVIPAAGAPIQKYCDTNRTAYQTEATSTYGCSISETLYAATQGADGKWTARYVSAYNGGTCNDVNVATPNSPTQPVAVDGGASAPGIDGAASQPQGTCPAGTCPGTVNGAATCQACSRTVGDVITSSVDVNASGVPTNVQTTGTKADCIGDSCQVTTTTSVNGTVTNVTTTTQSKDAMCKTSPSHPACGGGGGGNGNGDGEGGGGTFSGTCSGGFACIGDVDAITCAIAVEQHKRDCQFWGDDTGAAKDLGYVAMAAGDTPSDHPRNAANVRNESIGSGFDQTRLIAGGCPADRNIGPIALPLSRLCTPASWLGDVLVGLTALACLGIMFVRGS